MSQFSKIVLRNRIYKPSELSISMENFIKNNFRNGNEFVQGNDTQRIINNIYKENIVSETLEKSQLYQRFLETQSSGIENEYFKMAYKLRDDMAVRITDHIYVCRIAEDNIEGNTRIVPWYCIESEVYIADSWWEEDMDIL